LYLGNLNHALNPAMLHALGITHVVSVGESALHPPAASAAAVADSSGPGGQTTLPCLPESEALNALWHEKQAGRISVLDLKNVSDDGIDPLRSTMRVAVEYIESARRSGGKVLVHCRVGVSRSTTIVLAYVMAHLDMTLVESYLLVRSRRLSILIQPHLLFFWELRGWETFVASQKAKRQEALRQNHAMISDAEGQLTAMDCSLEAKKRAQPSLPPRQLTEKPVGASCGFAASHQQDDAFDLDVDIGQGAGSPYGFGVANVAEKAFGSGSPSGIKADALRLNWGFLCREIAALNERYF
jgi:dual specificity MAP kinase phosphatase